MKTLNNANHLAGMVLATLACVAFAGCTDSTERAMTTTTTSSTTSEPPRADSSTVSNTTIAAGDTETLDSSADVPPAPSETSASMTSGESATSTTTQTKTTKVKKHKAKKARKKAHSAWVPPAPASDDALTAHTDDDDYVYDYDSDFDETRDIGSMGVTDQYRDEETVSGVTQAPMFYRETGLSPFAQEPNSRMPKQIGSGQMTGEDKSTTVLEGPSLFQDPSALGHDLIH